MTKTISSKIAGERLRKYRLKMGYTQSEFGSMLNLAQNTICKYETEGINELDTIMDINQKLGTNLLEDTEEDKALMDIVLKNVYKWYNHPCPLKKEAILTKDILQDNYLYGYGKDSKALDFIIKKLEERRQLKTYINKLKQEDTNLYIMITAKSVLQMQTDQSSDFPIYILADRITDSIFQDIINKDDSKKITETDSHIKARQDIVQKENEIFYNGLNNKKVYITKTLKEKAIPYLSSDEVNAIVESGLLKEEPLAETKLGSYLKMFKELFPEDANMVNMATSVYVSFFDIKKCHLDSYDLVNRTYNELIQLFCNMLLMLYRKVVYGFDKNFFHYPKQTKYIIKKKELHPIGAKNQSDLIKEILPIEQMDIYDKSATNLLMNAIILYLIENERIDNEEKCIENITKLLLASNDQEHIDSKSPLDRLFRLFEQDLPSSKANQYYAGFKLASWQEQLRAINICINSCLEYCTKNHCEENVNKELMNHLISLNELNSRFRIARIIDKNQDLIYIMIYSQTLEEVFKLCEKSIQPSVSIYAADSIYAKNSECVKTSEEEFNYNIS